MGSNYSHPPTFHVISPSVIWTKMEQLLVTEACRIRRESLRADCNHGQDKAYRAANDMDTFCWHCVGCGWTLIECVRNKDSWFPR